MEDQGADPEAGLEADLVVDLAVDQTVGILEDHINYE